MVIVKKSETILRLSLFDQGYHMAAIAVCWFLFSLVMPVL